MNKTRTITQIEQGCLDLIEERINDCACSFELVATENIYDEDDDTVYRSFTFNHGMKKWIFCISPQKEIKYFEYGVPQVLVDEVLDAIR
mgnify:FL=1|tara:strand:+ start:101 stop:367 length:267 start_codon:yes stop_codon:yes gene_type:complete